jgi:uncharacterized repeat protein (TIGR03847 family)
MNDDFLSPDSVHDVQRFRAEALGEPGQRRFRLIAEVNGETYIVWMEKQQMQALGLAIGQILQQIPSSGPDLDPGDIPGEMDESTRHQFRLGRVELGFDEEGESILLHAFDIQDDENDPGLAMRFTRAQARSLVRDAANLAAAGRPMCPMCGQPMDPGGHVCPEQNGHLPLPIDDTVIGED